MKAIKKYSYVALLVMNPYTDKILNPDNSNGMSFVKRFFGARFNYFQNENWELRTVRAFKSAMVKQLQSKFPRFLLCSFTGRIAK